MKHIYNKQGIYITTTFDEVVNDDIKKAYGDVIISNNKYTAPMLENGEIKETYHNKITISYNKENGKVLEYRKGEYPNKIYESQIVINNDDDFINRYEYYSVINKELIFNENEYKEYLTEKEHKELEIKRENLLLETKEIEDKAKEAPFEFKGYIQPNRELQDQTSLLKILSFMQATKQKVFNQWKMKDKEGHEHYVSLTIQELMELEAKMQEQTTKTMIKWSTIREQIKGLSYDELKEYKLPSE